MRDRRREVIQTLQFYLQHAVAVYALDADLNALTVNVLHKMLEGGERPASKWQPHVIINQWQVGNKEIFVYEDKKHLVAELIKVMEAGKRCFVASNSKKFVKDMCLHMQTRFGATRNILEIDADNAQRPTMQRFIANIKEQFIDYDCVLASPALGTGVDITFPDNQQLVDEVFGFFEAGINSHFEIDQQLSRVRNPGRVSVWVAPATFRFETEINAILAELNDTEQKHRVLVKINKDGTKKFLENELCDHIYAEVTALQRASKNELKRNFIELRKHNGWTVAVVSNDKDRSATGKQIINEAKRLGLEDKVARIVSARLLDSDEYDYLKKKAERSSLSKSDDDAMRRYELETFYHEPISKELVALDDDGRFRDAIRYVELIQSSTAELFMKDQYESHKPKADRRYYQVQRNVLKELLSRARISVSNVGLHMSDEICADLLGDFVTVCIRRKRIVAKLFEIALRKDVARKPTQQLGSVLALFGVSLETTRVQKVGSKKVYWYTLDADSTKQVNRVLEQRRQFRATQKRVERLQLAPTVTDVATVN